MVYEYYVNHSPIRTELGDDKMRNLIFMVLLLISICAHAQTGPIPCPRNQPVIVYHQEEEAIYLFGGFCSEHKKRLNDLWKFKDQVWTLIASESAPRARSGHSMVYDAIQKRVLVFGGKTDEGTLLNDFWTWSREQWELIPGESPLPRQSHRMAFNAKTGEILLFGGSDQEGNAQNDTWIFKEDKWIKWKSKEQPPPRLQHTLSYDLSRDVMVLFGGFNRNNGEKQVLGDTWEWSPSGGWKWKGENIQLARDHHAMTYDLETKRTVLFGGYNQGYMGDTWSWDGIKWQKQSEDQSRARAGKPGLVFDVSNEKLVLFGGWDQNNTPLMDFWYFNYHEQSWSPY